MAIFVCIASASTGCLSEPKNIIFYGNSFTQAHGSKEAQDAGEVPGIFRKLAVAAGYPAPRVENAAAGGRTLQWHLENNLDPIVNPKNIESIEGLEWDYVVIQGYSTRPTHIGDRNEFRENVVRLLQKVRETSPGVKAVLYQTWARQADHGVYKGETPDFPGGPEQMQEEVRIGYNLAEEDVERVFGPGTADVAPVGDAWEHSGWNDLYAKDNYHANSRGSYLAALVLFGTVYDRDTAGLPSILESISSEEAAELQSHADAVLKSAAR